LYWSGLVSNTTGCARACSTPGLFMLVLAGVNDRGEWIANRLPAAGARL
jgi:hypothetical protein